MKRCYRKSESSLSRFFLVLFVLSILLFSIGCDSSFTFPNLSIWKRPPRKSALTTELAQKLSLVEGATVGLEGDDITIAFSEEHIGIERVEALLVEIFDALDSVIQIKSMSIGNTRVQAIKTLITAVSTFNSILEEEVSYRTEVTYKDHPFTLEGEFVFYEIFTKLRTPQELSDAFKVRHQALLKLETGTFSDFIPILHALEEYDLLSDAVKDELFNEHKHLEYLRDQIDDDLNEQEQILINILKGLDGSILVVSTPFDEIQTADLHLVPIDVGALGLRDTGFDLRFYNLSGDEITTFDLSKGGSTFVATMEVHFGGSLILSTEVVFKYPSVSLHETLYTIEDALLLASTDEVIVLSDTSFATAEVAMRVYGSANPLIRSRTTVVLPFDEGLETKVDNYPDDHVNAGPITPHSEYVRLHLPKDVTLSVKGQLLVSAQRAAQYTKYQGHVTGENYSVVTLENRSAIEIENRGELYALGFVEGEGDIKVKKGGSVYEGMFISSFRGGSASVRIEEKIFPFDQYTMMQIETPLTIEPGGAYIARAMVWVSQKYRSGDFSLVGPSALITLDSGSVIKIFDVESGVITLQFNGRSSINNGSVKMGSVSANTAGRAIPFDGRWRFHIASGSEVTINSKVALLPGSGMTIDSGSQVTVAESGELTVFNPYMYQDNYYNEYPNPGTDTYYRTHPTLEYGEMATLTNNGTLKALGKIGGTVEGSGFFDIPPKAKKPYPFYHVHYSKNSEGSMEAGWIEEMVEYLDP